MPADGNSPLDLLRRTDRRRIDDTVIVEAIAAICDEFEFFCWRVGVQAELRRQGVIVNRKNRAAG